MSGQDKTRIKHFHELGVNVYIPEFPKNVHSLVGFFAHGIDLMLKGQTVINYCPQIFKLLGMVAGRVFLKSMVISLVFETLMVRKDNLHHWMKSSTTEPGTGSSWLRTPVDIIIHETLC